MTAYRKHPIDDWEPRDLYVGPHDPLGFWEAYRVPLLVLVLVLVVVAIGLVVWLLWGGRG